MPSPDENFPHKNDRTFYQQCLSRASDEPAETPLAPATLQATHFKDISSESLIIYIYIYFPQDMAFENSLYVLVERLIFASNNGLLLVDISVRCHSLHRDCTVIILEPGKNDQRDLNQIHFLKEINLVESLERSCWSKQDRYCGTRWISKQLKVE